MEEPVHLRDTGWQGATQGSRQSLLMSSLPDGANRFGHGVPFDPWCQFDHARADPDIHEAAAMTASKSYSGGLEGSRPSRSTRRYGRTNFYPATDHADGVARLQTTIMHTCAGCWWSSVRRPMSGRTDPRSDRPDGA